MCVHYIGGGGCPADWVLFKTSCYFFSTEKLSFDNSFQKCNGTSSTMVIINDKEEQVREEIAKVSFIEKITKNRIDSINYLGIN